MKTITIREAAAQLGCSVSNVRKLIRKGAIALGADGTIAPAALKALQRQRAQEAKYLTTDQFCDQAGIPTTQAIALAKTGAITPMRFGGRGKSYLFHPRDVKRARKMTTAA